jgi:Caudovirus prohead serine protease
MPKSAPRGWNAGATDTRFADVAPQSFDKKARTVDAVISMGSPVQRFYGTEILRIDAKSVNLERMASGIPILDSHNQGSITNALGRLTETWIKRAALMGKIKFNETPQGEAAMGMVERGEVAGISAGYRVDEWEITDKDNNVIDPERMRWDDEGLTFTATRWQLLEASLVAVPADASASIRSLGSGADRPVPEIDELALRSTRITKRFGDMLSVEYELAPLRAGRVADVRARMVARQAMVLQQLEHHLLQLEISEQQELRDDDELIGGARAEAWRTSLGLGYKRGHGCR